MQCFLKRERRETENERRKTEGQRLRKTKALERKQEEN